MKNFILFGAAGYVAPRHMKAIKETGNNLVAICDPYDSVGVIDRHFPDCLYFKEFERLDRHVHKMLNKGEKIDYISIASPNYLHDAHCRWGLRIGADVICEKPMVLTEKNLNALIQLEKETGKNIYGLYQLRYHETFKLLENHIKENNQYNTINIDYNTPRGNWYEYSWKGYKEKSGGIETNIGCHLFDLCCAILGNVNKIEVEKSEKKNSIGKLFFDNAVVKWNLSTELGIPKRVFNIDGIEFSFDSGFTDLHTYVYQQILNKNGVSIENHRESIKICEYIRNV